VPSDDRENYPGKLARYHDLKVQREKAETVADGAPTQEVMFLSIAEELAGLAYILDGIRYSTRRS